MNLNLKNPIVFFDLETTGIDVTNDRIVEISTVKIYPNGKEEVKTYRLNPGKDDKGNQVLISKEAQSIHGISNEDVKDAPTFKEIAKELATYMEGCDFGGYNCNRFDIPLLVEEFISADNDFDINRNKDIDVQTIFHKMEKRTLEAAYKFYCGKELENAHSAKADTIATYEVLKSMLERYENQEYKEQNGKVIQPIVNDVEALAKFSSHTRNVDFLGRIVFDENNVEVFNFGKYKGKAVEEILEKDPGYYGWMMNGDFPLFTKKVLTNIKLRSFTKK